MSMSLRTALHQARHASRKLHTSAITQKDDFRLKDLYSSFQNPNSPFYLSQQTGEVGPASPEDHTTSRPLPGQSVEFTPPPFTPREVTPLLPHQNRDYDRARATAHEWFDSNGFDSEGRIEWPCAWGDSDMNRHINNVAYCRYFESSRMRWFETLIPDLGEAGEDFVAGRHTSMVLKEVSVRYRAPMTYPDAIIVAVKPHSIDQERAQFKLAHAGWSIKDNKLTVTGDSTCTMYDYDLLKKGKMSDLIKGVLERRAAQ